MDERFAEHLQHPVGRGPAPAGAHAGAAGGAPCGDLVRIALAVEGDRVADASFEASGCGAAQAAGSAAVALARDAHVLDVARLGTHAVAAELGGLSPGKLHAAELAADALARALGGAVAADGASAAVDGRVLVATSGGVDSAVAALLSGPDVVCCTLELWRDEHNDAESSCCSASAVRLARATAHGLGLPHLTLDLRDAFRAGVVEPWLADHAAGLTPNPCVRCNGAVRLDAMLDLAARLGAEALATGHYARIDTPTGLLRAAADERKDQSYMLAGLAPASIARLRFPLGELTKPEVRALAAEHGLAVATKADSQDLCFLAGTGREAFLRRHGRLDPRPGDVVDEDGAVVGRHGGAELVTVGQRRGLGLHGGDGEPLFALRTDVAANRVVAGPRAALATETVRLREPVLHGPEPDRVQLRYRAPAVACRLDGATVRLEEPFCGVAPGQVAVLRRGDVVVGHAVIAG